MNLKMNCVSCATSFVKPKCGLGVVCAKSGLIKSAQVIYLFIYLFVYLTPIGNSRDLQYKLYTENIK